MFRYKIAISSSLDRQEKLFKFEQDLKKSSLSPIEKELLVEAVVESLSQLSQYLDSEAGTSVAISRELSSGNYLVHISIGNTSRGILSVIKGMFSRGN